MHIITFLIGGTGNQFFQYRSGPKNSHVSTLFLSLYFRKILGWTDHEQVFKYPKPPFLIHFFSIVVLALDLILATLLKVSFFTEFDTRKLKAQPKVKLFCRLGYFQQEAICRPVAPIAELVPVFSEAVDIIVHVRGGDLKILEMEGRNSYGMLTENYYQSALQLVLEKMATTGLKKIHIITDDITYATNLISIPENIECCFSSNGLLDDISMAVHSKWFVASNSTLSFMICELRNGKHCITPNPYQKSTDLGNPKSDFQVDSYFSNV